MFICPTCSAVTELHDAFSDYVACGECGTSSDAEGFTPVEDLGPDELTDSLGF